jgi:hypothetical protein
LRNLVRLLVVFAAVAAIALVAAACDDSTNPPLTKVFVRPPWQGAEDLTYNLTQSGDQYGTCELKTTPAADTGPTLLEHLCGNGKGDTDRRSATVNGQTLEPASSNRTLYQIGRNSTTTFQSTYAYPSVKFHADENGNTHDTTRDLPKPTPDSPDPGYYDDESLFWVVRGLPLEKNWTGAYSDVNASLGQVFETTLKVEPTETVKVPAGTFTAWKVRVEANDSVNYFWVDEAAPHRVVQADLDDIEYQLTRVP